MNLSPPNSEVIAAVARNRIKEGRFILISLSQDKPMILKDGLIPEIDYPRALIAMYDELGEVAPTKVIKSVKNHLSKKPLTPEQG